MKTSSAKAKGRRLQQAVARRICEVFGLPESDVKSLPMGSQGCDVWLSEAARKQFPFAVECKNVEKLNYRSAFDQAVTNSNGSEMPLLVHSRNHSEILVTFRFEDLLKLLSK